MVFSGVIYHERTASLWGGHYTSRVKVNKLRCNLKYISLPYILIYQRITNFLRAPPILLNGAAEAGPTSELVTETVETMIRQYVLIRETESKVNYCSGTRDN